MLIRERQHLRKTYNEQWQQLQQELTKVGVHQEDSVTIGRSFAQECLGKQKSLTDRRPSSRMACVALRQLPPFLLQLRLTCYRTC